MDPVVREPIQTYLTADERADLDRVAAELGVSRSEALRRGIRALQRRGSSVALADLVDEGLVTPAAARLGDPPPSAPVASLDELLAELARDRQDR
jgi:Arc/MetJ-type ribon-helix-helix transcriptional regulator